MKKIKWLNVSLTLGLIILLSACGTSYEAVSTVDRDDDKYNNKTVRVIENPLRLEDFLRQAPGVVVTGSYVSIRGGGPPLFVIDNVPVGHSYSRVVGSINPFDIASVEVISGPETAIYGRRGGNGVIAINTKVH